MPIRRPASRSCKTYLQKFELNTFIWMIKHCRCCKRHSFSMILSILESIQGSIFEMNTFALKLMFCPKGPPEKRQRRVLRTIFFSKLHRKLKNCCLEAHWTIFRNEDFSPKGHLWPGKNTKMISVISAEIRIEYLYLDDQTL